MYLPRSSRFRRLRGKTEDYFSSELTKKSSLVLILVCTSVIVFDSTIVKFLTYSDVELSTSTNIGIFVGFSVIFVVTSAILLNALKKNDIKQLQRQSVYLRYFHYIIYLIQSIMSAIILILIIQMIFSHKYYILFLHFVNYISHVSALLFLTVLIFMFVTWFRSRKNVLIIMYTISFLLVAANIVVSLVYLEFYLSSSRSLTNQIRSYAIHSYVISSFSTPFTQSLSTLFDFLSLSSFLVIWSATLMLLYQYRYKIGRIKYFALICIPLIYYLFPFEAYFGNIFSPIVLTSPVAFGIIYVLTFSATKQVGAVLFSLGFLSASTLVANQKVRKALLISAIGIAILFGSIEISPLQYRIFPPYGLITEAFMPLGAYLLLVGIFTSATSVARDTKLRKEFYKSAMSQFNLLKTIGVTQMEKELLKEYKPILARSNELEEPRYQPLEQSDVKEIIHDVLIELQSRESYVAKNGNKKN